MTWKDYEKKIFTFLKETYKDAEISYDQIIKGRYSKVNRQIDILIESYIASKKIKLIVDGKYFNKRISVKTVESFISMVEDVNAQQGILITSKGFSKAAINRAN
jgi:predicted nucleotidyltransferase